MSKFRQMDIILELIELSQERVQELRQQLVYYRASVYKAETAALIGDKLDELKLVALLIQDEPLCESFTDYEAMSTQGAMQGAPGECSFSKRVMLLLGALDSHLVRINAALAAKSQIADTPEYAEAVRQVRHKLLALCRHGSRQWTFFQAL